jgi:transposase
MAVLQIRRDYPPSDLRRRAGRERNRRAAMRLLAIAKALKGMPRAEAARLAGMERQALHEAVLRFNAEGPNSLHDRPRPGRPERLSEGQQAALKALILRGPRPERDGVSAFRLVDLCEPVERAYGVRSSLWRLSYLLTPEPLPPEDPPLSSEGRLGRAGGVQKRSSQRGCRPSRLSIPTGAFRSGARMRRVSGNRGGPRGSGTNWGCAHPGSWISATRASPFCR